MDYSLFSFLLIPLGVSALLSFVVSPVVVKYAKTLKILDDPKKNKHPKVIHTKPIARGGVIPLVLAVVITSLIFLPFDKHLVGILLGTLVILVMGILDDRFDLNPYLRIFISLVAVACPIAAGIGISYITNPMGGIIDITYPRLVFELFGDTHSIWLIPDLFAAFWIIFLMNILNMGAKGIDGQLTGVSIISFATIALLSLRYSGDVTQWPIIIFAIIGMGAYIGFLPWHIYPQKIMPGYGGSTLAGYLLAVLSILSTAKVGTLLVVLGVPIIDTTYVVVRRMLAGKSPVWGDRGHLHHRLLDAGFSKRQIMYFYWGATLILSLLALNLNAEFKFYTIIGISFLIGGMIIWTKLVS